MYRFVPVLALAGALFAQAADAKTFRWAYQADIAGLDPHAVTEVNTQGTLMNVYETLLKRDKDLKPEPGLAESWTQVSPTLWRFKLRAGVRFHDGRPFDAEDVVFSVMRAKSQQSDLRERARSISAARAIDPLTVEIETAYPNPILLAELCEIYMMSKGWADANNAREPVDRRQGRENFATLNANGTGPFRVRRYETDTRLELEANPHWWDKSAHNLTEAIFRPVRSQATRVAGLLSGELDMIFPVPQQDVERLSRIADVRVIEGPEERVVFLAMDQERDELLYSSIKGRNPFKDRRVREAFYRAIDIEAIRTRIMRGAAMPIGTLITPVTEGWHPSLASRIPHDVERARALMSEAGYADGFQLTLDCPNDRYVNDEQICVAIAGMLARIGVRTTVDAQPRARYFGKIGRRDTSFYLHGWGGGTIDAHNTMISTMATRTQTQGTFNYDGWTNARFDDLLERLAFETDMPRRRAMIREALEIGRAEIGHIPLHQQYLTWATRRNVELVQRADDRLDLRWVVVR